MLEAFVSGIGVFGPGLPNWSEGRAVLAGHADFHSHEPEIPVPEIVDRKERRRCSPTVRLALAVATEAVDAAKLDPSGLSTVFANSAGDSKVVHNLLLALAKPNKPVSPTNFHNSVHNAPAGYWSIAVGARQPSTSIAANEFTFASALVKSVAQISSTRNPVMLVCYEHPFPFPLNETYPLGSPFAVGLVMTPSKKKSSVAQLKLSWRGAEDSSITQPKRAAFGEIWKVNPAARSIPLLELLSAQTDGEVVLAGACGTALSIGMTCT